MSGSSDVGYRVSSQAAEGPCVSVPKPQRTATLASKGVVWTHSRSNTNFLFFLCITCTRTCTPAGLPNRNTQHAVSWTPSLGFGWSEAQFSTPVFGAVIRGLFYFQERVAHTHVLWSTQREHWWIQSTLWHLLDDKWGVSVIVESSKWSVNAHIFPVPGRQRAHQRRCARRCDMAATLGDIFQVKHAACWWLCRFKVLPWSAPSELKCSISDLDSTVREILDWHFNTVVFCSEIACGVFLNPPSHVASTSETAFATSVLVTPVQLSILRTKTSMAVTNLWTLYFEVALVWRAMKQSYDTKKKDLWIRVRETHEREKHAY